jgi:hypothetical protein
MDAALLNPAVDEIMRRHELQARRKVLLDAVEEERKAARARLRQRDADHDRAWRDRCVARGVQPYPRPRMTWSREDGVETIGIRRFEGRRTVWGCASTAAITTHKTSKDPAGAQIQFPIPLKFGHKAGVIGQVVWVQKSPKALFVRASWTITLLLIMRGS